MAYNFDFSNILGKKGVAGIDATKGGLFKLPQSVQTKLNVKPSNVAQPLMGKIDPYRRTTSLPQTSGGGVPGGPGFDYGAPPAPTSPYPDGMSFMDLYNKNKGLWNAGQEIVAGPDYSGPRIKPTGGVPGGPEFGPDYTPPTSPYPGGGSFMDLYNQNKALFESGENIIAGPDYTGPLNKTGGGREEGPEFPTTPGWFAQYLYDRLMGDVGQGWTNAASSPGSSFYGMTPEEIQAEWMARALGPAYWHGSDPGLERGHGAISGSVGENALFQLLGRLGPGVTQQQWGDLVNQMTSLGLVAPGTTAPTVGSYDFSNTNPNYGGPTSGQLFLTGNLPSQWNQDIPRDPTTGQPVSTPGEFYPRPEGLGSGPGQGVGQPYEQRPYAGSTLPTHEGTGWAGLDPFYPRQDQYGTWHTPGDPVFWTLAPTLPPDGQPPNERAAQNPLYDPNSLSTAANKRLQDRMLGITSPQDFASTAGGALSPDLLGEWVGLDSNVVGAGPGQGRFTMGPTVEANMRRRGALPPAEGGGGAGGGGGTPTTGGTEPPSSPPGGVPGGPGNPPEGGSGAGGSEIMSYLAQAAQLLGGALSSNPYISEQGRSELTAGRVPSLSEIQLAPFYRYTSPTLVAALQGLYQNAGLRPEDLTHMISAWRPPTLR